MARAWTIRLLLGVLALDLTAPRLEVIGGWPPQPTFTLAITTESTSSYPEDTPAGSEERTARAADSLTPLTNEQQELVDFAESRFDAQRLELPNVHYVFHDSLLPCNMHTGVYLKSIRTVVMCSMDLDTMLHELAHAWAGVNLSTERMREFVVEQDLDSWNDHDDEWGRRGTEHVAETIAWALADHPRHVRWVESLDNGSKRVTHRLLTLGIEVENLLDNFRDITGEDPLFRNPSEWSDDESSDLKSPELARLRG
jgi:hypothetical protein